MRLRHALLVLIAERPQTGYDLARRMQNTLSWFWSARHSQIYPELAAMERDELVAVELGEGPGPRDRKIYSLTASGRDELGTWLVSEADPPPPVRDELVLRAFGAASADHAALAKVFAAEVDRLEARIEGYELLRHDLEALPGAGDPRAPEFGWLLSLQHGIINASARRQWARLVISRLRSG